MTVDILNGLWMYQKEIESKNYTWPYYINLTNNSGKKYGHK